jgi:hypothetical protein
MTFILNFILDRFPLKVQLTQEDKALLRLNNYAISSLVELIKHPGKFYSRMLIKLLRGQKVIPNALALIMWLLDKNVALNFKENELELEFKRFSYIKDDEIIKKLYLKFDISIKMYTSIVTHATRHSKANVVSIVREIIGENEYMLLESNLFRIACVIGNTHILKYLIATKSKQLRLSRYVDMSIDNGQYGCSRLLFINGASNRLLREEVIINGINVDDVCFILWMKETKAKVHLPEYYFKYIELSEDSSLMLLLNDCEEYNKETLLMAISSGI